MDSQPDIDKIEKELILDKLDFVINELKKAGDYSELISILKDVEDKVDGLV